jgi:secreted Zn-dependent insulinase-like peptidase
MGLGNQDIDNALETLPDLVAEELMKWRIATLEREKVEALLYARFKGEDKERTATEIKALIHANGMRYAAVLEEIKSEAGYERIYEKLMSSKKRADLRNAF